MTDKPGRSDAEVQHLAAELRARWTAADGIAPWLRRQLPNLTRRHDDEGWSWADIGRALNVAGIRYGTGRAWTGLLLARKVAQAREQLRKREARRAAVAAGPVASQPPPFLPDRSRTPSMADKPVKAETSAATEAGDGEPKFALARLANRRGAPPEPPPARRVPERPASTPRPKADVDAVMRQVLGGTDLSSKE